MDVSEIIGPDETVREIVPRHWINIVPTLLTFAILGVVSIVGIYLLGRYGDQLAGPGAEYLAGLGLLALLAFAGLLGYISIWIYRQNMLILTTKNLYQVTQNSLFSRKVSQFSLERLQDVSAAQNGILATILGFGDVTVETAGDEENFVSRQVPDPRDLAGRIMKCHRDATESQPVKAQP